MNPIDKLKPQIPLTCKHNRGPWSISTNINGKVSPEFVGLNSDGKKRYNIMVECPDYFMAGVGGIGKEECLANAALIAAAPDLLAACIELSAMVAEMLPKAGPCGWGTLAVESAQAAIAKATSAPSIP